MKITYLGHAGFYIETPDAVVVMDPWLSPEGAFDSAWFQFPQNHHLGPWLREQLATSSKPRFIYISHEHSDHFDPEYLATLPADVTYIIGNFQRPAVKDAVTRLRPSQVLVADHGEKVALPGGGEYSTLSGRLGVESRLWHSL
jgi:UDP-MurNAc hydroxylase